MSLFTKVGSGNYEFIVFPLSLFLEQFRSGGILVILRFRRGNQKTHCLAMFFLLQVCCSAKQFVAQPPSLLPCDASHCSASQPVAQRSNLQPGLPARSRCSGSQPGARGVAQGTMHCPVFMVLPGEGALMPGMFHGR
ncbi:hypothetical protein Droror1_Dr00022205 [Drosera rotundifolia]